MAAALSRRDSGQSCVAAMSVFQRWLANLRVLEIDEIKSIPSTPSSRGSIVADEYAPDQILVDLEAECTGDLLGNLPAAQARVALFHLDDRSNQVAGGTFGPT
ncbi:MAG: hypothetical protein WCA22_22800 [Candidatus Binatus sp.]